MPASEPRPQAEEVAYFNSDSFADLNSDSFFTDLISDSFLEFAEVPVYEGIFLEPSIPSFDLMNCLPLERPSSPIRNPELFPPYQIAGLEATVRLSFLFVGD